MQNGPVDKFTALTRTTFVTISVFMSRGHFQATSGQHLVQLLDNFWTTKRDVFVKSGGGGGSDP